MYPTSQNLAIIIFVNLKARFSEIIRIDNRINDSDGSPIPVRPDYGKYYDLISIAYIALN